MKLPVGDVHQADLAVELPRLALRHRVAPGEALFPVLLPALSATKSENGYRRVTLPAVARRALEAYRAVQDAERELLKGVWGNDCNLVFTNEAGEVASYWTLLRTFKAHLTAAGIPVPPRMGLHAFRRTAADAAKAAGLDSKGALAQYGWSDERMWRHYQGDFGVSEDEARRIKAALFGLGQR